MVIDVAMTETARLADYVLPAATQFEKPEATFFNFEFPRNTFHLRHPLFEPLPGTLPEAEIWARLVRALGRDRRSRARASARRRATRAGRHTRKPSARRRPRTHCSRARCRTSSTRRWARRCPQVSRARRPCGGWRIAARWNIRTPSGGPAMPTATRSSRQSSPPVGGRLHPRRVRRRLRADRPSRQADRPRDAGDARRARHTRRRTARQDLGPPDRAVGRGAPLVHGQRHLPRPSWRKRDADGALRVSAEDARGSGWWTAGEHW